MKRYTYRQAARLAGTTPGAIRTAVSRGRIQRHTMTKMVEGLQSVTVYYITEPDLNRWLKARRKYERKSATPTA